MKKIIVLIFAVGLVSAASAQFRGHGYYYPRTSVVVGVSPYYGGIYPYYGYPYAYPYRYAFPPNYFRPSKLDVQIQSIRHDYEERIESAKMNLRGRHKRQEVRRLKKERDYAIDMARKNYYNRQYH